MRREGVHCTAAPDMVVGLKSVAVFMLNGLMWLATESASHSHIWGLGFSVLPKDTSTCGIEEVGLEPLTL